jgi:hypothetical protein
MLIGSLGVFLSVLAVSISRLIPMLVCQSKTVITVLQVKLTLIHAIGVNVIGC